MDTAGDVFTTVAAFLDDPEQDVITSGYLRPFLQTANNRLFQNVFANPNINGAKMAVMLANVPAGTNHLGDYMKSGGPIALLSGVFDMREKPTGQDDSAYRPMRVSFDLPIGPNIAPTTGTMTMFNGFYVPVNRDILLPGASQALDIRIFGEFKPVPIADEDTPLIPDTEAILTHWVSEIVGLTRGAPPEFVAYHKSEKDAAIAELFNQLIMHIQEIPTQQRPYDTGQYGLPYSYFG